MTAKDILDKNSIIEFDDYKNRIYHYVDIMDAMKEIAELAFDAGFNYSGECLIDHLIEISHPKPDKEQFIKELFQPI